VFCAPTRPLVAQQIHACAKCTWIAEEHMAELTGDVPADERQRLWQSRRVFFCTPQTFENDLAAGRCPAREVVCLVLDEAHKAQGEYAYTNVVKAIAQQTDRFRVLALTATPGADRAKIQRVITNCRIAHVEVRHEDEPCLRKYMHARESEVVLVQPCKVLEHMHAQARMLATSLMPHLRRPVGKWWPLRQTCPNLG
jgi:Fanconi anemia group M protein